MMQVGLTQEDILQLDAPEDAAINCDRMHHIWQQEVSKPWILKIVFIGIFWVFSAKVAWVSIFLAL